MADLEAEQEKAAGLGAALDDTRQRLAAAEGEKEVANARLARAQKQVVAANEAAADLDAKATGLAAQLQVVSEAYVGPREGNSRQSSKNDTCLETAQA